MGVILSSECYEQIYKKGAYLIPPDIARYDETIDKDATRIEINLAECKHKAQRNDRQLYETDDNACLSFIMAVVDETWYKELEGRDLRVEVVQVLELLVPRFVHHRHNEG